MKYDNLSVRILKYIMVLAEEGNFTKASEKLFITQPSLSQAIRRVEQELEADLFVRSRSRIELTKEGKAFVKAAEHILDILFELDQNLTNKDVISKDRITIGTGYTLGAVLVQKLVSKFRNKYPQIDVHIVEAKSQELEAMTREGMIDVCFVLLPLGSAELRKEVVTSGHMVLVMSKTNPLNQYAFCRDNDRNTWYFDLRQASTANFLSSIEGNRTEEISRRVFKKAGFVPHVSMRFRNIPTAIKLVEESNDLLLIPDIYLLSTFNEKRANESISCYHIVTGNEREDDHKWVVAAAYQQDASRISSSARLLINLLGKDKVFF